jgi:hypothetical protein
LRGRPNGQRSLKAAHAVTVRLPAGGASGAGRREGLDAIVGRAAGSARTARWHRCAVVVAGVGRVLFVSPAGPIGATPTRLERGLGRPGLSAKMASSWLAASAGHRRFHRVGTVSSSKGAVVAEIGAHGLDGADAAVPDRQAGTLTPRGLIDQHPGAVAPGGPAVVRDWSARRPQPTHRFISVTPSGFRNGWVAKC